MEIHSSQSSTCLKTNQQNPKNKNQELAIKNPPNARAPQTLLPKKSGMVWVFLRDRWPDIPSGKAASRVRYKDNKPLPFIPFSFTLQGVE